MTGRFAGKVVLVTGGAAGIGHAIATAFGEQGASLAIAEIRADLGEAAAREFEAQGIRARAYPCDVATYEDVQRTIAGAIHDLGGLHVLVNNAGISMVGDHTQDLPLEIWHKSIDVMQTGVFYCSQVAGRHFLQQRSGNIINIASLRSFLSTPGMMAYCTTKAAVVMMTKVMAAEWAPFGVRVNAIAPGPAKTAMWEADAARGAIDGPQVLANMPMGRLCMPEDIAKLATFLASDDAEYITGTTVMVDGGVTLIPKV